MAIKLLLLFLFALNGFGILGLPNTVTLGAIIAFANNTFAKPNPYRNILILILICIFLSFIPAHLYRGQSFFDTFRASASYFYIITFFAILKLKPSIADVEKAMVYLSIIASLIYIVQFILFPLGIAILPEGTLYRERFRMAGSGIWSLAFFYGINRYILTQKVKYILLSLINVVPIILLAFRTQLAGVALFSIILLFKTTGGKLQQVFKYMLVGGVAAVVALQIPAVSDRVDYMIEKQELGNESFANKDYIRWVSFDYYVTEFPESSLDRALGAGIPLDKNPYFKKMEDLYDIGIFWQDWGIVGLAWLLGPFTVMFMLWLSIKCCRMIPNNRFLYIGIWLTFLITVSIGTTTEYFNTGNFVIHSIAWYIIYRANYEDQKSRNCKL